MPVSVYRTSNQAYGGRAPTVHEMPVSRKPRGERGRTGRGGGVPGSTPHPGILQRATVRGGGLLRPPGAGPGRNEGIHSERFQGGHRCLQTRSLAHEDARPAWPLQAGALRQITKAQ